MADGDSEFGRGGRAEPGLAEAGLDARVVEHRRAYPAKRFDAVNIGLWVAQALLAFPFAMAGSMKATTSYEEGAKMMAWAAATPPWPVKFIGVAEVLGAIGLLLPAITRIQPRLTPWAATGLATLMALAVIFHVTRGEFAILPANLILGGLAAIIAWGRFAKAPIQPRS